MVYFTSDTHFFHSKVIQYSKRPFDTVENMNAALIFNWNSCVKSNDTIWHLGDFAFAGGERLKLILDSLNGKKGLILGNHDDLPKWARDRFELGIHDYKELTIEGQNLVLFHYPIAIWHKRHYGAWQLHGYSHGEYKSRDSVKQLDVGVDVHGFKPISFEEIKIYMDGIQDNYLHHGRELRNKKLSLIC